MLEDVFKIKNEELKAQPYDRAFKNIMSENPTGFLKMINIEDEFKCNLKTNMTTRRGQLYMDWAFESTNDKLFHFEFETSTISHDDLKRYFNYDVEFSKENKGKPVNSKIILGRNVSIPDIENFPYDDFKLPLDFIDLNKFDGDEILNKIKYKNINELTNEDIVKLSCMPMFSTKMDYDEYLLKVANFTKNLEINEKDLNFIMENQMLFSRMTKNKETQKKIVRMFEMRIEAVELYGQEQIEIGFKNGIKEGEKIGERKGIKEGIKEGEKIGEKKGIKEGIKEGEKKEKFKIAKNLKNMGISNEDIIKSTGISSKDLKSL